LPTANNSSYIHSYTPLIKHKQSLPNY